MEGDIDVGVTEFSEDEESHELSGCSSEGKRVRSKTDNLKLLLAKAAKDRNSIIESIQKQNEQILSSKNIEEDDVDLFFKSLALTVKKLPNKGINEIKIRTLALVTEIQDKYSAPQPPLNFNSSQNYTSVVPDQTNYYEFSSISVPDPAVLYPMSLNYPENEKYHHQGEQ